MPGHAAPARAAAGMIPRALSVNVMNSIKIQNSSSSSSSSSPSSPSPSSSEPVSTPKPANDRRCTRLLREEHPFTRCYRRFTKRLRAGAAQYVNAEDLDDLVQDVWAVAAQRPAKLAQSDRLTLAWLVGIAKRCAPTYESASNRFVPLDELLAGEAGDDLEGRGIYEDIEEMRAEGDS
jgi:hypothetical protein